MSTALLVSIAIFLGGVIFSAGRLSVRVDKLEESIQGLRTQIDRLNDQLDDLRELLARQAHR